VTIGNNFFNLNSTRGYPLDDQATGLSEDGLQLPNGLIVDLCLRFPDTLGVYAFLSAVHVSDRVVSVAISATDSLTAPTLNPIAVVALAQPVAEGRAYSLQGLAPGVGGYIVFGKLDTAEYQGAFATGHQGLLLSQQAKAYPAFPIPWAAKPQDEYKLQDVVRLIAGRDLQIVRDTRLILGSLRDAIVFSLSGDPNVTLAKYVGPCGSRPESGNCIKPPITAINEVIPDANGNIQIVFPDMSVLSQPHALLISTSLSLPGICPIIPVSGRPDTNYCDSAVSDDSVGVSVDLTQESHGAVGFSSQTAESSVVYNPQYPFCVRFYSNIATPFRAIRGDWRLEDYSDFNYVVCPAVPGEFSTQRRVYVPQLFPSLAYDISLLNDPDYPLNTGVRIHTTGITDTLTQARFGFVLDYRVIGGLDNFTAVFLDIKHQQFTIQRMAGGVWQPPAALAELGGVAGEATAAVSHGIWYDLQVTITPSAAAGRVDISAMLANANSPTTPPEIVKPAVNVAVQVLNLSGFGINSGSIGFLSMTSFTRFTHFFMNLTS
jgi:hypothetical protein